MPKSKKLRKQTCFKIQFYVGIHLTWKVFGLIFSVLDFIPVVFFSVFGLKSGHLKMQIPQGRSAQIKKLKKQTGFKIQFYIGIQLTWSVFVILGHFGQSQRALILALAKCHQLTLDLLNSGTSVWNKLISRTCPESLRIHLGHIRPPRVMSDRMVMNTGGVLVQERAEMADLVVILKMLDPPAGDP